MKRLILNVLAGALFVAAFCACGSGSGSSGGGKSGKIKITIEDDNVGFWITGSGVATVDWGDGSEKTSLTLNNIRDGIYFSHTYPNRSIRTITVNGDNITGLNGSNISPTSLDVSKNTALTRLKVIGSFTSLDASKNTALTVLEVYGDLTSLDVSKNTALTQLFVHRSLTSLDVSKNTALTVLDVSSCQLTAVALNDLFGTLHSNTVPPAQSFGLNERKHTALAALNKSYNQLKAKAMKTMHSNVVLLAQGPSSLDVAKIIKIGNNPGTTDCDRSIAEKKGWTVREN